MRCSASCPKSRDIVEADIMIVDPFIVNPPQGFDIPLEI